MFEIFKLKIMLNEDLLTPNEIEIYKLKKKISKLEKTIQDFKEYDTKRKEYYKDLEIKVGQLESYIEEIEDTSKILELNKKYREQLSILNKKVYLNKIAELSDGEITILFTNNTLREQLKDRDSEIKRLREANQQLILKLNKNVQS
jgi:hypothetical protein